MKIRNLALSGATLRGLAASVGLIALSATPGLAQESYYLRAAPPAGVDDRGYAYTPPPRERVIIREVPAMEVPAIDGQVVVRQAPSRVIVVDPYDGPYDNEVYLREAPPYPAPAPRVMTRDPYGPDCRMVEQETRSGLLRVATVCD